MTGSHRDTSSRLLGILSACLAAILGFLAFNVIDGVFGFGKSLIGLAAGIALTLVVFRRPPRGGDADA
jgi:membrane associated rhomboid family serine protease